MNTNGNVKGILQDQSGKPVNNAIIMIVGGTGEFTEMASVSGENGEFRLSNVDIPGKYDLQIQSNGNQINHTVNIVNKDSVITISL